MSKQFLGGTGGRGSRDLPRSSRGDLLLCISQCASVMLNDIQCGGDDGARPQTVDNDRTDGSKAAPSSGKIRSWTDFRGLGLSLRSVRCRLGTFDRSIWSLIPWPGKSSRKFRVLIASHGVTSEIYKNDNHNTVLLIIVIIFFHLGSIDDIELEREGIS